MYVLYLTDEYDGFVNCTNTENEDVSIIIEDILLSIPSTILLLSLIDLNIKEINLSRATNLGEPIQIVGGDKLRRNHNDYHLTLEILKALSSTSYTGQNMKKGSGLIMMNNIINDIGYTGIGIESKLKNFLSIDLPEKVAESEPRIVNENDSDDLPGQGVEKISNPIQHNRSLY